MLHTRSNALWVGQELKLHLDHINGVRNDNRFSNLRFLCPNCHQCTPTWGNKGGKGAAKPRLKAPAITKDDLELKKPERICLPCKECGSPVKDPDRTYCSLKCYSQNTAKAKNKITKEELEKLIKQESLTQIGKRFGVSATTVKNWCDDFSIETPGVGYWAKRRAEEAKAGIL